MAKLSNCVRDSIKRKIIKCVYDKQFEALDIVLKNYCYNTIKLKLEQMNFDFEKYKDYINDVIYCNFYEKRECKYYSNIYSVNMYYPLPVKKVNNDHCFYLDEDSKLKKCIDKILSLKKEKKQSEQELEKILCSVNTENQLLKLIPEFKNIIDFEKPVIANIVPIETINNVKKLLRINND